MSGRTPPADVPEGTRGVVWAEADLVGRWTYDLWIVDGQHWTGLLRPADAHDRLVSEGYSIRRARQLLRRARSRADRLARAGRPA